MRLHSSPPANDLNPVIVSPAVLTLQQITRAADWSLATVSYALRDDPRIRSETKTLVQKIAAQLCYRPNPRFSALMSPIRTSRPVATGERIAFVWVHTSRAESAKDPFLQRVFLGAKVRAEALGYGLEQFWTAERGMTDRRLSQVIKARGIVGVLLSPVMHEAEVTLDLEWSAFAPAVIGSARWNPERHHARTPSLSRDAHGAREACHRRLPPPDGAS